MGFAVKALEKGTELLFSRSTAKVAKTVIDNKPLLTMAKKAAQETGEVVSLRLKPDISIPIRPATIENTKPAFAISYKDLDNEIVKGEIGNMALRLEKKYASQLPEAQEKFARMFPGMNISVRPKSAASIYSKILKNVKDKKLTLKTDADVNSFLLALVVGITLIITAVMAKLLGGLLPIIAKKLKIDPAIMASPLITTIVDSASVFAFFNVALAIMM